jgi:hypothetical protein
MSVVLQEIKLSTEAEMERKILEAWLKEAMQRWEATGSMQYFEECVSSGIEEKAKAFAKVVGKQLRKVISSSKSSRY